jgi:CBS domain-containing protein
MAERLTTGEICTRSVTIAYGQTSLVEAAQLMRRHHVGCVLVVAETARLRKVVGILTDRDIVTAVIASNLDLHKLCVEDVMVTDLVTARAEDSLIDLMHTMRDKGVRRVPVVGPHSELVGIATLDDVLVILAEELNLLVAAMTSEARREQQLRS